jgi:hypothetical protein
LGAQWDIIYLDISEWVQRCLTGHATMVEVAHGWIHCEVTHDHAKSFY